MTAIVWKYDLDLSGTNPNNLVSGEVHTVPLNNSRAFATNYGPYYSDSVVVKVKATGVVLTQGVDYQCLYLYPEATARSGKPVNAVIHVINESVDGDVMVDYQVVGGEYSSNAYALEEIIAALEIDNRAISWANITNKPVTFPPEPHLHPATDLYGFEYLVDAVNDLTSAVLMGDAASHDQIYIRIATVKKQLEDDYNAKIKTLTDRVNQLEADMDAGFNDLQNQITTLSTVVTTHINRRDNPHVVTYTQTGAVPTSRTVNGKALSSNIVLTAGDVGAYTKTEVDTKVTALQNADAQLQTNIDTLSNVVTTHINRRDNPHVVTYTQTGAVPTSRTVNGKALTANIVLTASDVGAYTTAQVDTKVTALQNADAQLQTNINSLSSVVTTHINRRDNPHVVTYTQTGSVPTSRTVNGKALSSNITLTAGDVGAYTKAEIDAKFNNVNSQIIAINPANRLGARVDYKERRANERMGGGVMTAWADYGGSNYWVVLRPLYYRSGGQWVLTPYD